MDINESIPVENEVEMPTAEGRVIRELLKD